MQSEEISNSASENISNLKEIITHQNLEITRLQQIIRLMKRDLYGSRSEKFVEIPPEQMVFNELELPVPQASQEVERIEGYSRKKTGKGKKKPYPDDLPREEVIIDLPEADKKCPIHGTPLKKIGEEITEKIKIIPARASVLVEKKIKYASECCEGKMAQAKSPSVLPGIVGTHETLAFLFFSKFYQGLPLYRLEEYFNLQGIMLSRTTMAYWLIKLSEKLQPIWNVLEDWVLESGYMGVDATSVQVLKEPGRKAETKSYMWARGSPELGIVLFDYNISGSGKVAEEFISGFTGAFQSDAHPAYNRLEGVTRLGCMMHSRRKFNEAFVSAQKRPGVAQDAMKMIKKIYGYEESYKERNYSAEQRYEARQREVKPYMEKFRDWCEKKKLVVLPSSPLGIAVRYYLDEYDRLTAFLQDGRYEIDNGWIERAIRKFAIGRNNWLFCESIEGARASSLYYSFSVTAKLNGKDPYEAMLQILQNLNSATTIEDYEHLAKILVSKTNLN